MNVMANNCDYRRLLKIKGVKNIQNTTLKRKWEKKLEKMHHATSYY